MLSDILQQRKCFKLILGLGNQDLSLIEKLVYVYSKAGCNFFDVGAEEQSINAVKRGLEYAQIEKDRYICVSIGQKNDIHIRKAFIDESICLNCEKCINICPQFAIKKESNVLIDKKRCIGCGKCFNICPNNAISMFNEEKNLNDFLKILKKYEIDCVELHLSSDNEQDGVNLFNKINTEFKNIISICINRDYFGNNKLISYIKSLIKHRKPYTTIIQADGYSMSGGRNDFKSTLQAVACAEIILNEDFKAFVIISGGTNSKSAELANICDVDISGVAIGSYARKIVFEYIKSEDFYNDKNLQQQAIRKAKELIDNTLKFIN